MRLLYLICFLVCIVQSFCTMAASAPESDELEAKKVAVIAQEDCLLANLPELALMKIAKRLPDCKDIAHIRQTCKLFNLLFKNAPLRSGNLGLSKYDTTLLIEKYNKIAREIVPFALRSGPVSLDLSGNYVERFMYAGYQECRWVKKLRLVGCNITSERDNFFNPHIWANLEELDMSSNFLGKQDRDLGSSGDWVSGAYIWTLLCKLPNLKKLILRDNHLRRVPKELFGFSQLEYLDLRENPLPDSKIEKLRAKLSKTVVKC